MANVIEFVIKGVDNGSGALGKFSKTAGTAVKSVAKMSGGLLATTTALVAYVSVVNANLDKQAKFATRIGQSVEELTRMQHAAAMASIPLEQFNMATQRMTRRTAEAAKGFGEASGALRELGIDAKKFGSLGLEAQMGVLADKFGNVQKESDKLRLAFKLFDSEGTAMLQMLKAGSPALQQAANDAEYLGIVLSKQGAANAEKFSDEMTRAQGAIKGVSMGISAELTPLMTGLLKGFTDMTAQGRPAIVAFVKDSIQGIATLGVVVSQVFGTFRNLFNSLFTEAGFRSIVESFAKNASSAMSWVIDLFVKAGPVMAGAMYGVFKTMWEGFAELGKWGLDKVFDAFTGNDIAGTFSDVLFERIPAATAETRKVIAAMWEDLAPMAIEAGGQISDAVTSVYGINVDLAKAQAAEMISSLETFGTVAEEQAAAVTATQTSFLEAFYAKNSEFMATQKELAVELAESTYELMMSTIDAVSEGVAGVIVEGGNMMDALRSIGQQVLKDMIGMLIKIGLQRLITATISNAATATQASAELAKGAATTYMNAFSSTAAIPIVGPALAPGVAAASTAAAVAGSTAASATGSALGATIAGARADGGPVGAGQTYLVGERGPELFTARTNGSIVPNEALGGGGGVVIENLVINVLANATNADALLNLPAAQMRDLIAEKFIPALDALAARGVVPQRYVTE